MKCLVTGAAGFIGSHLCERLLHEGHEVIGVDCFVPYYPREVKEANLFKSRGYLAFSFHALDLRSDNLESLLNEADTIFHLAAMPGLQQSWTDFDSYTSCNLLATQRLLDAWQRTRRALRFIYGSTSSVYGRDASGDESLPCRPVSPYGVTKLAAENLCRAYEEFGLPLVVLRYFSVYGPRQRPDMAYHRFIRAILDGKPIEVHGDGRQIRGNTFVADCVDATLRAMSASVGETYNVGGGEAASLWDVIAQLENLTGRSGRVTHQPPTPGDQRFTLADTGKIRRHLGWQPRTGLGDGLAMQVAWQKGTLAQAA